MVVSRSQVHTEPLCWHNTCSFGSLVSHIKIPFLSQSITLIDCYSGSLRPLEFVNAMSCAFLSPAQTLCQCFLSPLGFCFVCCFLSGCAKNFHSIIITNTYTSTYPSMDHGNRMWIFSLDLGPPPPQRYRLKKINK